MRMRKLVGMLCCCLGAWVFPSAVYAPPLATMAASQTDVLVVDLNGDGVANQGDTIRQSIQIRNTMDEDALDATLREFLDPNTTLVPGSIRTSPIARNDTFLIPAGLPLFVSAPGLLDNDDDADGDTLLVVTPDPVSFQGVPVAVEKDGGFTYLAPPGFTGVDVFFYGVEDDDGLGNDAEVRVTVIPAADLAVTKIDDPDPVLPGEGIVYLIEVVNLGPSDAVNVVLVDTFPAGSVFGGASWPIDTLTESNVTFRLGDLAPASEVTVKIGILAPEVSGLIENLATVDSSVMDLNLENNIARETTLVNDPPDVAGEVYASLGNVGIEVPAHQGVLANDSDPEGTSLTVTSFDATSAAGGEVLVGADGAFRYLPAPGFEGLDLFGYTAEDIHGATASAVATVTVHEVVWFADNAAPPGGDGRLHTPFSTLAEFSLASEPDDPGDTIFVATGIGPYPDYIALEDDQVLVGEGADLAATAGLTPPPFSLPLPGSGDPPTLAGDPAAVVLAAGNTLTGFDVLTTAGAGIVGINVNGLVVFGVNIETTDGPALWLDGGSAVAVDVGEVIVRNNNGEGVVLANLTGTTRFDVLAIENANATGFTATDAGTVEIVTEAVVHTVLGPALEILRTEGRHQGQPGWAFDAVTSTGSPRDGVTFASVSQDIELRNLLVMGPMQDGLAFEDIHADVTLTVGMIQGLPSGGHGVRLDRVMGSTLIQGANAGIPLVIEDIGTGDPDSDCGILHVHSGDLTVQFVDIRNVGQTGDEHGIRVLDPLPGSRAVRVENCSIAEIGDTAAVGSGSAIEVEVTAAHHFTGLLDLDIADNSLRGDGAAFNTTATGVNIDFSAGAGGTLNADVNQNDLDGVREGIAFLVKGNAGSGALGRNTIQIANNQLDDLDNNGIEIDITDDSTGAPATSNTRILILNNTLHAVTGYASVPGIDPDTAIEVEMRGTGNPTLSVDIKDNTINSATGLPWSGEGILVGTAALDPFSGTGFFDIENNLVSGVRSEGIVVRTDELATVNVRVLDNTVVAGDDGLEVDVTNDPLLQRLLIAGNNFSTTSTSTSDVAYDIETETSPAQDIECEAGCPLGTGTTTPSQNVTVLTTMLNHNGNTVSGSDVTASDVDIPLADSFNIVPAGTTPGAN